jgi:hypothetical protein
MKKIIYIASAFFAILYLSGCSSTPSTPSAKMTSVGGKFYMVGDSNCAYYKQRDENSILCANQNKQATGYRNALSDQELQYKMHREQLKQAQEAASDAEYDRLNNNLKSMRRTTCIRTGNFVNCY